MTDSSICMRAGLPLYQSIPLIRLGNSLRKSWASGGRLTGGSTVLTALIRSNACEVVQLSMVLDEPFATQNVSTDEQLPLVTVARNFPHRVSGLSDMYGYTLALVSTSCGFDLRPSKSLLLKIFTVAP